MYYHIQIITNDNQEIYEFDKTDEVSLKEEIIIPHIKGINYELDGYTIYPTKVKRLIVTRSSDKSSECVNISYSRLPSNDRREIYPQNCVFDNESFADDITDQLLIECKDHVHSEISKIEQLKTNLLFLSRITKNLLDEKIKRKFGIIKLLIIGLIISYYGGIIYLIYIYTWDCMEPVFYILGVAVPITGLIIILYKERTFNPVEVIVNLMEERKKKIIEGIYQKYGFEGNHKLYLEENEDTEI